MTGGRHAKKREFSKVIISTVGAATIVVTAFTLVMVWRTGDTSGSNFGRSMARKSTTTQRRYDPMFNSIVGNLVNIGWSMLIFLSAYLANVTFSLWYNIKLLHEPFDREKLINSAYKIATFVIGLTLLCVAVTTLPLFANEVGWEIPQEYTDLFADLVIIGAVLLVSCKYIKEAFVKFNAILNAGTSDAQEKEKEVIDYE